MDPQRVSLSKCYCFCGLGLAIFSLIILRTSAITENSDIVLDESRPDVFYCPTGAYADKDKKILSVLPIAKLCEYGAGAKRPKNIKSDCVNDVDETPNACDEKARLLKRMKIRRDAMNLVNSNTEF